MKTISKALIAVMVAAAMCLVPVFAIADDSDAAATLTTGKSGIYVKADTLTKQNFDDIMGGSDNLLLMALASSNLNTATIALYGDVDLTKVTIEDASGEMSKYCELTDDYGISCDGSKLKYKITCEITFTADGQDLFSDTSAYNVDLVKYAGTKTFNGGKLTVVSTVEMNEYEYNKFNFVKNADNDLVYTSRVVEESMEMIVTSDMTYKYKVASDNMEKDFTIESKNISCQKYTINYDFDDVKSTEAKSTTPVFISYDVSGSYGKTAMTFKADGKSGGYEYTTDNDVYAYNIQDGKPSKGTATVASGDVKPIEYTYYGTGSTALFTASMVEKAELRSDAALQTYLKDTVKADMGNGEDAYGDAKSVANSASDIEGVSSGSGSNNIIFYIIIGVLAVAVVALAVLMIKKK